MKVGSLTIWYNQIAIVIRNNSGFILIRTAWGEEIWVDEDWLELVQ
jgi:hypothetical protein